jgi:hypothetical protein
MDEHMENHVSFWMGVQKHKAEKENALREDPPERLAKRTVLNILILIDQTSFDI